LLDPKNVSPWLNGFDIEECPSLAQNNFGLR